MDRKRQTPKAYASHVRKLCPKDWTANELHTELCNSTSPLTSKKVDLNRPCTGSETQFCHIYDELSLWNEVLCHCHMQIKEVAPKELAISAFHGTRLGPGTAAKARSALVLVRWLLMQHHCVKALRIQGSVILENSELLCALAEYLGDNCTLRDLTLDSSFGLAPCWKELTLMFGALARNKALQKLHLIGYPLFEFQHQLVVEAMTANQTLQSLHITDEWSWLGHKNFPDIIKNNSGLLQLALEGQFKVSSISELVKSFTEAICVNKTMQKLCLNWSGVSVCDTKVFCSALAKNQSLQMVTMSNVDEKLVEGVYNVLKETGTEHRVHFTSIFKSALVLQGALENCSELTEVCYCPALHGTVRTEYDILRDGDNDYLRDDGEDGDTIDHGFLGGDNSLDDDLSFYDGNENGDDDYRILNIGNNRVIKDVAPEIPTFRCLNTSKHLVKLVIMMNEKICEESAELLAQFLALTKTLKRATLSFPTTESSTQSLLNGLLCNKSISKLELGYWCFKDRHAEDFAQVLRGNNTLNHLTLHQMSSPLILQELAKCIADNKFLLCINFDEMRFFTGEPWMIRIMDTLRRNSSLLQCAVYFVVGNHFKRCGEAFEQLFRSRTLLEKVQELDSESESVAKERILNSKRHLDINFLAVAGVVKSRVACSRGNGSQMKLDEVGVDNWLLVRSYLKLTDIKNASDEPCPPP
ncbi:hypothetical protein HPB47_026820 [Ixodes persulcatus]|uniref:Uncharacterized protein n=1 Tax=Ixodes persulcatus TaxID=34615 RepID=A0AC60PYU7_IXOPE|nr:hypothetical protein HPB47_026820 [Ixodes persulcatus]